MDKDVDVFLRRDDLVQSSKGKSPVELFETLLKGNIMRYTAK